MEIQAPLDLQAELLGRGTKDLLDRLVRRDRGAQWDWLDQQGQPMTSLIWSPASRIA